jgi:hypothetical protein
MCSNAGGDAQQAIRELGALQQLISLISSDEDTSETVCENALFAVCQVIRDNPEGQRETLEANTVEEITNLLKRPTVGFEIVRNSCVLLDQLLGDPNSDVIDRVSSNGTTDALFWCFSRAISDPSSEELPSYVMSILTTIAEESKDEVLKTKVVETLTEGVAQAADSGNDELADHLKQILSKIM